MMETGFVCGVCITCECAPAGYVKLLTTLAVAASAAAAAMPVLMLSVWLPAFVSVSLPVFG